MIQKCDRIEEIKTPIEKDYKTSTAICEAIVLLVLLVTVVTVFNIIY